jgi:hypothetical protein
MDMVVADITTSTNALELIAGTARRALQTSADACQRFIGLLRQNAKGARPPSILAEQKICSSNDRVPAAYLLPRAISPPMLTVC